MSGLAAGGEEKKVRSGEKGRAKSTSHRRGLEGKEKSEARKVRDRTPEKLQAEKSF